ncbi:hypothetical protein NPIL_454021 [Nephila pilipes]|uniref:Uncharacterized protein n=1 Tax=Nephila pilipes TaxID=299642 RepID=A0A8X6NEC6_NEPPI|nr:hypothetical protein NPIL_454021 [Nephila pilipes]
MMEKTSLFYAVQSASETKASDTQQKVESSVPLSKQPARSQISVTAGSPEQSGGSSEAVASQNKSDLQQNETQNTVSGGQNVSDPAKRIQDFSSSSSGGSTQHSLQQKAIVPDLSSLQLKLAQLTFTGSSIANDPNLNACSVQGSLQSTSQSLAPSSVPSVTTKSRSDTDQTNMELSVASTTMPMQMTCAHTSSIVTPVALPLVTAHSQGMKTTLVPSENISSRRHTVATNIEGLKLELQKIHTPSVPSVNLKSNIEQGLQAIFSISSTAQTVTTPAHSSAYNHTHQLSTSTPMLNTPTEMCGSAAKSPIIPPSLPNTCIQQVDTTSQRNDTVALDVPPSTQVSRFKVTPVIENQPIQIPVVSDTVNNVPIATPTELNVKKQGRFHITVVADEVATNMLQSSSSEDLTKKVNVCCSNTNLEQIHLPVGKLQSLDQQSVTGYATQNISLQHSSSNPALMSSIPQVNVPQSQGIASNFTRSISDIAVAEEYVSKLNAADSIISQNIVNSAVIQPIHDQTNSQGSVSNVKATDLDSKLSEANGLYISDTIQPDKMKPIANAEYGSTLCNTEIINKQYSAEKVINPPTSSTVCKEFENREVHMSDNLSYGNQSLMGSNYGVIPSSQFIGLPHTVLSSSLSSASSDNKLPLNGFQGPVNPLDIQKMHHCLPVSGKTGNISYPGLSSSPVVNHVVLSVPDSSNKVPETPQFSASSHQMIQGQPSFLKDANANPLYCTYNSEDGKHLQLSQSEEENKNYEMLECNDEYLKVILERQEQERLELSRRHQQELQSYKMHHLRTHYGRKCCYHSKSTQSAVASSQTGNEIFSGYGSSLHHSKDQIAPECAVSLTINENMHINNTGMANYEMDQKANMWSGDIQQQIKKSSPVEEMHQAATIVNKQSDFGIQANIVQPDIKENMSHLHSRDPSQQLTRSDILGMCSVPVEQRSSDHSCAGISDPSLTKFTMPQLHVHDVHTNENMAALTKKSVGQRSLEVAPHSSPQTVRRIINATSAINVNPAFHHVSPLISSSTSVSQLIPENETYNGHSHVINVSLPCSQSSDVIVSSPSKPLFPQPDS